MLAGDHVQERTQQSTLPTAVGIVVGIIANIVTAKVLDATGSFQACFALTAAIYLSELVAFFGLVKPGALSS